MYLLGGDVGVSCQTLGLSSIAMIDSPSPSRRIRATTWRALVALAISAALAGCGVPVASDFASPATVTSPSATLPSRTVPSRTAPSLPTTPSSAPSTPSLTSIDTSSSAEQLTPAPPRVETTYNAPATASEVSTPTPPADLIRAAREALSRLPIQGRAPKTGYDRDQFGQAWSDDVTVAGGHNGCDTRNDILSRDLDEVEYKPGTRQCVVLHGVLHDPYSGEAIEFVRGINTSVLVQIDHVVALSDAWQKGAQQLNEDERRNFANDPLNLQATSEYLNQQKGDGDAATWQPPNKGYRCEYAARQIVVKDTYHLWVTQAEHDALIRELGRCPETP